MTLNWKESRRRLQHEIYMRDNGECFYCRKRVRFNFPIGETGTGPDSATLDHIVAKADGGKREADNLVLACGSCNNRRGSMPADIFLLMVSGSSPMAIARMTNKQGAARV